MGNKEPVGRGRGIRFFCFVLLILGIASDCQAQADSRYWARKNSFGILAAYSNDSSHILLGDAEQRKLLNLGASYSRSLLVNRFVNWQYDGELLPMTLESDPLTKFVTVETSPTPVTVSTTNQPPTAICTPITSVYSHSWNGVTYSGTSSFSCSGRQWTIGEGLSPLGFQWNLSPRSKLQPFFAAHGGYMYSTRAIPVASAGAFNFTFDLGAGVEAYRSHSQSVRLQYEVHHISNGGTADYNCGIDNGVLQVSYVFGR